MSSDEPIVSIDEPAVATPSSVRPTRLTEEHDGLYETGGETLVDQIVNHVDGSVPASSQHHTLKHHLLGPSLTKAGQNGVDQKKVAEVIYEASKGSKYFNNEEVKDTRLTAKIERILKLKAQLEKLDLKHDLRRAETYIAELELSRDLSQYVVHIDCDAFYAAVEEIDRPELKHVPMAVGVGVLTTCNYEARKYGCRSAMAGFVAKKLCPNLVCLPLNFEKYTAKAREVRAVLAVYDPRFESSSIDEAYLNITKYCDEHDLSPEVVVGQLRNQVQEECKVTISAGIAPNAKIAKICSNKNKPNGQFRVPNERVAVMAFMRDLPIRKVNGIGRVLERELQAVGVNTCGEIYDHRAYLNRLFGEKTCQFLLQTYLGLGRTDVSPAEDHERKSVGTESTFRDMYDPDELRAKLKHTAESLEGDMKRVGVKGRTLVLKIKLHTYEVFTRQVGPPKAVWQADDLYRYSEPILAKLEREMPGMKLRLMGLRCTHLVDMRKPDADEFFGRKSGATSTATRASSDADGWEVWPDAEFEAMAQQERVEEFEAAQQLSQEHGDEADEEQKGSAEWHEPFGKYKYGSEPATPTADKLELSSKTETWSCPICSVIQPADDRTFNEHIDLCLSKNTIRDTVAEVDESRLKRSSSSSGVKRKAVSQSVSSEVDHRQRKLFFG